MKSFLIPFLATALVVGWGVPLFGQSTTWTNGGSASSWKDPNNWSNGVPSLAANNSGVASIGTQPTSNTIGIDTGVPVEVASFRFNSTLTPSQNISVVALSTETLQVDGVIANNDNAVNSFVLPVISGASALYTGGTGLHFGTLSINLNQVTTTGTIDILQNLNFTLNSISQFGTIGSVVVTGATVNVTGSYTGHLGDTFFLTSGNFSGSNIGLLPTLNNGLVWNTSNFKSNGELIVAPEPPGLYLLVGSLGLLAVYLASSRLRQRRVA